ncbi:hypothetical protein [Streptomyces mangrovisoli]|uniref:Uncharacterized protein n=1 Tax=Streptomyces mangrovisoli TaxID=1428628 RepID=A0A1J4NUM8_9ACTN|nr:hypothetical protein [Streptomyces mangrovisoli]OIJ64941.1 hypothetical protein WN71_025985 [Streptomyces mangrovisoli]
MAPDYVLAPPAVVPRLVEALRREIAALYGEDPLTSPDYGRIVDERHVDRIAALLDDPSKVAVKAPWSGAVGFEEEPRKPCVSKWTRPALAGSSLLALSSLLTLRRDDI